MASNWTLTRLGDKISLRGGLSYRGDLIGKGSNHLVGMGCVSFTERFLLKGLKKYAGDFSGSHLIKSGELVIATRQQSDNLPILGFPAMIPEELKNHTVIVATNLYKVTNNSDISNRFLYWLLRGDSYRNWILGCAKGTTVRMLTKDAIENFTFLCPPVEIRDSISNSLDSLDEKIDINRQINRTLEAMAQAIFKSWFVDFDPVKAKIAAIEAGQDPLRAAMGAISGKTEAELDAMPRPQYDELAATAALFPDELVESELGDVPNGWEVKSITDIAKFANGKIESNLIDLDSYISTENMLENRGGIAQASSLPSTATVPRFSKGQILVSNIRPYFKKIWLARFDGGRSADVLAFEALDQDSIEFVYNLIYQDDFFEFMMRTSKGAKMPRGDKDAILGWKFVCAETTLTRLFSLKIRHYYSHIESLNAQVKSLSELRDTLLPKLLSGELSVSSLSDLNESMGGFNGR